MAAPRKYSEELKERATRMALDARQNPATKTGAIKRIADQLDIHPEALRTWVRQAEIDAGDAPGTTTADTQKIADLEREVRELRRANEMADSTGGRNEFCELLRWCQIAERFAWSSVEGVLDRGQLSAGDDAQIGALREVLA